MGKLEDLRPEPAGTLARMSVDRRSVWPYVDGAAGRVHVLALRAPDRASRRSAKLGDARGRARRSSSPPARRRRSRCCSRCSSPGKTVALAEGCYFGTGVMMREELGRWGLQLVEFDQTGPPPDGADLVWLEAPSNPFLTMPDFEAAAAHPARVVVDSTAATPVYLRPLEHGADFVAALGDEVPDRPLGRARRRDRLRATTADYDRLWQFRQRTGPTCSADVAALVTRGLKTLRVRVERQTETARDPGRSGCARTWWSRTSATRASAGSLSFDVPATRSPVETRDAADQERHVARRRRDDDGVAPPLGGRPRARSASSACRSGSRTRTSSGPTSTRRSPPPDPKAPVWGHRRTRYPAGECVAPSSSCSQCSASSGSPGARARSRRPRASSTRPSPPASRRRPRWSGTRARAALHHRAGRQPARSSRTARSSARRSIHLSVDSNGERGLLGVELDPNFATNHFLYLYYTVPGSPPHNRLSAASPRQGDTSSAGSEQVLLNLNGLSSATNHNGGAIHFGGDGKLYVARRRERERRELADAHQPAREDSADQQRRLDPDRQPVLRHRDGPEPADLGARPAQPVHVRGPARHRPPVHQRRRPVHLGGDQRRRRRRELRLAERGGPDEPAEPDVHRPDLLLRARQLLTTDRLRDHRRHVLQPAGRVLPRPVRRALLLLRPLRRLDPPARPGELERGHRLRRPARTRRSTWTPGPTAASTTSRTGAASAGSAT